MKPILSLLLLPVFAVAAAQTPDAVISLSVGQMRAEPDYESPLETQILMGTPVQVIGSESYWRKVVAPDYKKAEAVLKKTATVAIDAITSSGGTGTFNRHIEPTKA